MIRSRGRLERVLDLPPFSSIHLLPDTAGNQPIFPAHEEHEDHRAPGTTVPATQACGVSLSQRSGRTIKVTPY